MHSEKFWRFLENFVIFLRFQRYYWTRRTRGVVRQWFSGKNPLDLLVFWLWFSPPSEKIFRNLCILKKFWRFFENFVTFLCSKDTIEHAASGWCAAVIFWKKSTRFAGFLAVVFTPQWKNLQKFMHSEKILEISEKFSIIFDEWWWVMMSDTEWWWVMMSDEEWWWRIMNYGEWW